MSQLTSARRRWLFAQICIKYSRFITCQSNTSKGRGHDRLPNWNQKNGGMLISQPISSCLTNHSELCMSRPRNNQPRRISIYRLQRRPSFGFESSVYFDDKWWPCGYLHRIEMFVLTNTRSGQTEWIVPGYSSPRLRRIQQQQQRSRIRMMSMMSMMMRGTHQYGHSWDSSVPDTQTHSSITTQTTRRADWSHAALYVKPWFHVKIKLS